MVDANESLGMIGLRAVPGVLDVVPVFHPVVVVQIPGARKGMRPSLQTASGGGALAPENLSGSSVPALRYLRRTSSGGIDHITLATTK